MPKKEIYLSWSSGKDSAWALQQLQKSDEYLVKGLFTTINEKFDRVAMHAVRVELLKEQAKALGLPIDIISLPFPCENGVYERIMQKYCKELLFKNIHHVAFGDLYLEDVRDYRIKNLENTGLKAVFPIWGFPTKELSKEMIVSGLRTVLTCVDPKQLSKEFCGNFYSKELLSRMPKEIDPCGENGEFHTFVFDGPMFKYPLPIEIGETVERDGFVFTDVFLK